MIVSLKKSQLKNNQKLALTGSKSESNRLLILQALCNNFSIDNLSESDDTKTMQKALSSKENTIDIHHAGTAMRFLTAYFATKENSEIVLTGSSRMKERPIKILVDALTNLGCDIEYIDKTGFPPLRIKGTKITTNKIEIDANVSSQYISALILIASKLDDELEIKLKGRITSIPYIKMTLSLLNKLEIENSFENNLIKIKNQQSKIKIQQLSVESDWSSASYFFSLIALSKINTTIKLTTFKENSLQGDAELMSIYKFFGVQSSIENEVLTIKKTSDSIANNLEFNLINCPDIAQTIIVTCFGLGISCNLQGLHTLKIKETDRLLALKTELEKLGASVDITDNSIFLEQSSKIKSNIKIDTYQDHRMAMSFAPLVLKTDLIINDANVVTKSFPTFWSDLKKLGIELSF